MNHRPPVGQAARAGNAQSLEFVMRHGHHQSVVQARIGQGGRQGDSVLALRLSAEGWETERQEREYMSLSKVASISNLDTAVLAQSCASHLTQCLWSSVRRWAMTARVGSVRTFAHGSWTEWSASMPGKSPFRSAH